MIRYTTGNMFESNADCLVNTVNCEGFMGKGIAYQFKMRFPDNNKSYEKACRSGELVVGKLHHYVEDGVTIINFPTKDKWREKSKMEYIENGMDSLASLLPVLNVKRIAIPPLGCGNGGLNWEDVRKVIEEKIVKVENDYEFIIYEPSVSYRAVPKQPPKVSVSALVLLDVRLQLKKFNSLRMQKTGYFINFFLKEDYFKFDKWKYGPYSHSIEIVARSIKEYQNFYKIDNSKDTFDHIYQTICSEKVDQKYEKLHAAVKKAAEYVNQIKTDKKLEGIATVLFLVQSNRSKSKEQIIKGFKEWSENKAKRFSTKYILECIEYLEDTSVLSQNIWGNYELTRNVL